MNAHRDSELNEAELADTIARIWPDFWIYYAERIPGAEVLHFDGATAVSFGFPHPLFNQVAKTDPQISGPQFTQVVRRMNQRGLPWMWAGSPDSKPDPLQAHFAAHQMFAPFTMPGMALDLHGTEIPSELPASLVLEEACDLDGVRRFVSATIPAYELPVEWGEAFFPALHRSRGFYPDVPVSITYGEVDGAPVCGSVVFFTEGIANIVCVGTLPEYRGKGYARAAVWQSVRTARDAGCRYAVLHASSMGLPVYERMGFRTYFQQPFYMPAPPAGAA